jgi:cold shock CspA family protein
MFDWLNPNKSKERDAGTVSSSDEKSSDSGGDFFSNMFNSMTHHEEHKPKHEEPPSSSSSSSIETNLEKVETHVETNQEDVAEEFSNIRTINVVPSAEPAVTEINVEKAKEVVETPVTAVGTAVATAKSSGPELVQGVSASAATTPAGAASTATADSSSDQVLRGKVRWFNTVKGYGFIAPWVEDSTAATDEGGYYTGNQEDWIFVHYSEIKTPPEEEGEKKWYRNLMQREIVDYRLYLDDKGRKKAKAVTGPDGTTLCSIRKQMEARRANKNQSNSSVDQDPLSP